MVKKNKMLQFDLNHTLHRYKVFAERKKLKHYKINANLTISRSKLLHEAIDLVEDNDKAHFIFADMHGDIKCRLNEGYSFKGNQVFSFMSLDELKKKLEGDEEN